MNRTHLIRKGLLKFRQLIKSFFESFKMQNWFYIALNQSGLNAYKISRLNILILGMITIGHLVVFAQHPAPTFTASSYSFCAGDNLSFTLSGLPDPSGFPGNDAAAQITWYLSTSGPASCGTADVTGVESVTLTSTSHTFNTSHILSYPVEDNSLLMITTSIIDPLDAEGMQQFITAQTTCVPVSINPLPIGTITPTDGSVGSICEGGVYQVDFTATVGTGPYDLIINGTTFSGITSGATLNLTEGLHFSGGGNIDLTSITDTGVTPNCTTTGTPISTVASPSLTAFIIKGTLSMDETICAGSTASTIVGTMSSGGTSAVTYGWESSNNNGVSWMPIMGVNTMSYSPGILSEDQLFRRIDTLNNAGSLCWTVIDTVSIIVNNIVISNTLSADEVVCEGQTPTPITGIPSTADGILTYGWQFRIPAGGWSTIVGAIGTSYAPPGPITAHTQYRRIDTSEVNGVKCFEAVDSVTIYLNDFITVGNFTMDDDTICANTIPAPIMGTTTTGTGAGAGVGATYGWQFTSTNGAAWLDIPLETSDDYTPAGIIFTDTWYRRIDTINLMGTQCTTIADTVKYIVNNITVKGVLSTDQIICTGTSPSAITGSTSSGDGVISYGWESTVNATTWNLVVGETSTGITPGTLTMDTWYRRIDTTNLGGIVCTEIIDTVKIFVNSFTSLGTLNNPDDTICSGTIPTPITGTMTTATGTVSYGWEVYTSGSGWTAIAGATGIGYTPPSPIMEDTWYRRIDTSSTGGLACTIIVDTVKYVVNNLTVLGSLGAGQTICTGIAPSTIIGSVTTGDGIVSYGWQSSTDGANFVTITGETGLNYAPPTLNADAWYRRIDTTTLGTVQCFEVIDTVKINVNNIIISTVLSADQIICSNQIPRSITGSPSTMDGSPTYGWEFTNNAGATWNIIPGEVGISYTPTIALSMDTWYRRIDTSNVAGVKCFEYVDTVRIIINDFTFQSVLNNSDEIICAGTTPTAITGAPSIGGDIPPTYGWELTTDNGTTWTTILGATATNYTPSMGIMIDTWYRRIDTISLSGVQCTAIVDTVKVTVNNFLTIGNVITNDDTICTGIIPPNIIGNPSTGDGTISYGWDLSTDDGATWTPIAGATFVNYLPPTGIFNDTWYRRIDTTTLAGVQCTQIIDTIKIVVNNFTTIGTLNNPDDTICTNVTPTVITGTISNGDGVISYGWEQTINNGASWTLIPGEANIGYTPGVLTMDTWYRRIDTATLGSFQCIEIVDTVKIIVNNLTTLGSISADKTICQGTSPSTITGITSSGDGAITYGWESSTNGTLFNPIAGANGINYTPSTLIVDTWYIRIDTTTLGTSQCFTTIDTVKITVNNISISTVLSADETICSGDIPSAITGIISVTDGGISHGWEVSNDNGSSWNAILGENGLGYTPTLPITTNTWYRRIDTSDVGGIKCYTAVDTVVITINPKPVPVIAGTITEICINDAIFLPFTITGGSGSYTDTTWLTSDVSKATVTANGLITGIASGFSNIKAVVTDANGCKDTSNTHAVIILPLPVAGAVTGPNQVCIGDSITLTANPSGGNGGNMINWSVLNGTGSATINAAGVLHPISAGTVDVSYAVTDNKSCGAISAFYTVTIDTIPVPIIVSNDTTICQGDIVTFIGSGGDAYEFLVNNINQQGPSALDTFRTNTLNHNDQIKVVVTNSNGCFDTSSVIMMVVDTIPLATLVSDAPNNVKGIGQTITFTASGGTTYEFFVNNTSQGAPGATTTFSTNTLSHLDTVIVEVTDGNTCSDTAMIVMTINDRPIAVNDTVMLMEDALFETIDVQANDTDPEGDLLTTIIVTDAVNGVNATINDSTIQYMPNPNFNGLDSIEYWVCDDFNNCAAAKVYITVKSVNDIPVANNDTLRIIEDDPTSLIEVLANDIDADGDSLNVTILTVPSKGVAIVVPDSTIAYTPFPDSNGIDVIAYKVCDTKDSCNVGIAFIEIMPVNDRPNAIKDSIIIQEDSMNVRIPVLANDTDADRDVITLDTVYPPTSGGTIMVSNDTVIYNPPANFNGLDSIKYAICDTALCDTTYLIVNITPVNEAPIAVQDSITIPEDTSAIKIAFTANDLEFDGETILVDSVMSGILGNISITNDTVCYTPFANANGIDSLKYIITDGTFKDSTYIIINILPINDRPIAVNDTVTVPENSNPAVIPVQINDSDPDGDLFATGLVSGPSNGTAFAAAGSIFYTPPPSFNGIDSIKYNICDAQVPQQCDTATIFITVTGVNDPPIARNDTICIGEDTTAVAVAVELNDFDLDGDVTTVSILTRANHAIVDSIRNDSLIYQPTTNFNGLDSVRYQLYDGILVDQAWVYITIKPRNDAPTSEKDSITIIEDMANVQIAVTANDSDIDEGDSLKVAILAPPTSGGTATVMDDTMVVYTPGLNFFGKDTIVYQVCDTSNACVTDTICITVQSVNERPIAVDDFLTINEDAGSIVIDVQANDSDGDGDSFVTTIISTPMEADTLNGDSIRVTAPTDFTGVQVIVYKICDPLGLCDTANVTITILPINDPPVANTDNITVPQDTTNVGIAPLLNDTDVDDITLSVTTISTTTTANGSATLINPDSIIYTPLSGFSGIDTIHYIVCDTSNACTNGLVIVTVGFVNTPPTAFNDSLTLLEDGGSNIVNVLLNDTDIDGLADSLKVVSITTPVNGGLASIVGDSSVSYTPALNFNGLDSIKYTVCDTSLGCATAWVIFTITQVNDAPLAINDTVALPKDTMGAQIAVLPNDSDIDGDALTVTTIGSSTQGVIPIVAGNLIGYSAPSGYLGIDTITYKVTDTGGLMDTAILIIVISDPNNIPPTANPDFATTIPSVAINIDVQANDVEPNGDNLVTTIIGGPKAGNTAILLNLDSIQYTPAITFAGYDTIWYQVCDPSLTCDTSMAIILVENTLAVSARVILEGPYDRTTLLMHDSLRKLNLIPSVEPYSNWPRLTGAYEFAHKNGGGNEIIGNPGAVLGVTGPNAIVDWVYLELLTAADTVPVASRSALIQRDGDIVDIDGVSPVAFERLPSGNYFLSIRHRNHLGVMTKTAQAFSQSSFTTLDFSVQGASGTEAFGTHAMDTVQSRLVLWAGDGNADRSIIYDGIANDRDPVFFDVITDPLNINSNYNHVSFGYYRGDYDMKGSAIYLGSGNDPDVIFFNVFLHPNNAVGSTIFIIREQIPR